MTNNLLFGIEGHIKIYDPDTMEVFVDKNNAIHYENFSEALALSVSSRGYGTIYQMAFGNGGASVDKTGFITYFPPNVTGQNAALYNETYKKIVDDTLTSNPNPAENNMTINHISGKIYTDILVKCTLGYGEPSGQSALDNGNVTEGDYVFDELGLVANWGYDDAGLVKPKLLTHVVFHPVQKSLNRQIQIDYTIRIQSITNRLT